MKKTVFLIITLLNCMSNVNAAKNNAATNALFESVYCSDHSGAQNALKAGADTEGVYTGKLRIFGHNVFKDQAPLRLAAARRDVPMVKLLLDAGANPNSCNKSGSTALHTTTDYFGIEPLQDEKVTAVINLLLNAGAVICKNAAGTTPLMNTVQMSWLEATKLILERDNNPQLLFDRYQYGETLLHYAACRARPAIVNLLLHKYATASDGNCFLGDAGLSEKDFKKTVEKCNKNHILYLRDERGRTPYHEIDRRDVHIAQQLYAAGIPGLDAQSSQYDVPYVLVQGVEDLFKTIRVVSNYNNE